MRRRPDLIVPVRDRRRSRRVVTARRLGIATIALLLAFAAITIRSELRRTHPGEFGRLQSRVLESAEEPVEIVTEAPPPPVADQTVADPMLIAPMAREQWLGAETTTPAVVLPPQRSGESTVTIAGDADGVVIVRDPSRRGRLAGGFGR
jgi:hypothetical protein